MESGRVRVSSGELIIIRHGETDSPGTLNGRTDVGLAVRPAPVSLSIAALWVSPARRARETAAGLFPGVAQRADDRLWEQSFGVLDGVAYSDLPNLGTLSKPELADLKAEGGESFHDLLDRARPALEEAAAVSRGADAPLAIVAHAGIVRATLALALGNAPAALAFQVGYLGATRLTCYDGGFAVTTVNERLV